MFRLGGSPPTTPVVPKLRKPEWASIRFRKRHERLEERLVTPIVDVGLQEFRPPCEPVNGGAVSVVVGGGYGSRRQVPQQFNGGSIGRGR